MTSWLIAFLLAAPPPDADMSLAPWFQNLRQPQSGASCCSMSDCRPTDWRTVDDHYEARVNGAWMSVPPEVVLHQRDNPTGHAVVCYAPSFGIICFVRGPET